MAQNAEYIKTMVIKWLLEGNLSFNAQRDAIGAEVLFSVNKRRADLLILSKNFHALEIKGDFDNLDKLKAQLDDYHKTFDKVSLVITPKYLPKIRKIIKPSIGLILFKDSDLTVLRAAKKHKRYSKLSLLMFLHKNDMIRLFKIPKTYKISTDELRILIAEKFSTKAIHTAVYSYLKNRYRELFRLFHKDVGDNFLWDELKGLCGKIGELHA
jgi:hypothetical protein